MRDFPPVAIVILTWNAKAFTQACLESLQANTDHSAWRVIVVDNGSSDGSVEWLNGLDWLTLIDNGRNLGFSKGCNIGIRATTPDEDVVLLNNDLLVTDPRWLSKLQEVAYSSTSVGVVGTRQVNEAGLVCHLGSYMQPLTLRGQQLGGLEIDINQCPGDRAVESVVFAQAYIRRYCIDRVGLLDEDLFAYFEDSDYCLRARRAGMTVMCAGGTRPSVHRQNTSTRENKVDFWTIYNRSQKVFRRNWARWLEHERHDTEIVWHSVVHQPRGYAAQSRKLMEALHFADVKVAYRNSYGHDDEPTGDLLLDDLMRRRPRSDVAQVALCQADAFGKVPAGAGRIGWTMLEVTGLPQSWVDGCNTMDEVWVPASFNVETFRSSGVTVPIQVMPLGVDVDYFHPGIAGFRPSPRFTFLSVFEWGERKAPELLLRAFAEEFKATEDVVLVLAVSNRDPAVDVEQEIAKLDLGPCAPIVLILNADFAPYQMGSLYRSADCFVLPTRGEGWGMPVLEAMACGLPVIATDWSGPAAFLHDGIGYPLKVKSLVKAEARCPYYEGFEWAEPDFDNLRFLMRQVFEAPERARTKGMAAAAEVAATRTWKQAAQRVKERLLELTG
ncbi:MAG: glycosyltransferase [Actinomycetota bacterium]|nr:glycosyltransferase [Actinomycetota bacterium]